MSLSLLLRRSLVASLVAVLPVSVVLVASRAGAEVAAADARLVLRIDGSVTGVTAEQLRAAISAELGVRVDLEAPGVQGRGVVVVRFQGTNAVVTFESGGHGVTRTIPLPKASAQVSVAVALLVGNLARDEAAELLAELQISVTVGASASASASASAPASASASAPASASASASASAPASASASASAPVRPLPPQSRCTWAGATLGADFVPGLGSSTTEKGRSAVRIASLNGIGGVSRGLVGVEVGGAFNIQTEFMCGVQIAGAVNVVTGSIAGVQLAGGANIALDGKGVQVSGGFNYARDLYGVQLTGGLNLAHNVYGVQLAPVNVTVGRVHGVQLGVFNYADDVDVPIGVLSIVRNGRTHIDVFTNDSLLSQIAIVHGGRRVHNIWGLGVQPGFGEKPRLAATYGIGIRAASSGSFTLDIDALFTSLTRFRGTGERTMEFFTFQNELRALFGVPLVANMQLIFGPSVRVLVSSDPETKPVGPLSGTKLHDERGGAPYSNGTATWLSTGATVGLRF